MAAKRDSSPLAPTLENGVPQSVGPDSGDLIIRRQDAAYYVGWKNGYDAGLAARAAQPILPVRVITNTGSQSGVRSWLDGGPITERAHDRGLALLVLTIFVLNSILLTYIAFRSMFWPF